MKTLAVLWAVIVMMAATPEAVRAEGLGTVTTNEIMASIHTTDIYGFEAAVEKLRAERQGLGRSLSAVLNDKMSANMSRCAAAFYLGELRLTNEVDALATNISLKLDIRFIMIKHLIHIDIRGHPAANALVTIGMTAVPKLVQNLANSDDPNERGLWLNVLCRIEGDKDIVQIRLQKAASAEPSAAKKARLQSALAALPTTKFGPEDEWH
jgi:hypothetical protein